VDDQKAPVNLDRHHFEHHAVLVGAQEHDPILPKRRVFRGGLADDRVGGLDDMAAALAADSMLRC
jgi:hypothetical protein